MIRVLGCVGKELGVFLEWCIGLGLGSCVYEMGEIVKEIEFIDGRSKWYGVEYGGGLGWVMGGEEE